MAVLTGVAALVLAGCGSAGDLAAGGAVGGSGAPALTDAGGVVVTAHDLDPDGSYPDDPVAVAVYVEPLCPHCKAFSADQGRLLAERLAVGAITLEYRLVSFLDTGATDHASARSVNAALCVETVAGPAAYGSYIEALLADQTATGPTDDTLVALADETGADSAESCIRDQTNADLVPQLTERAMDTISGTPTVVVDGKTLTSIPTTAELNALLGSSEV